jgi:hypothetical protein
VFVSVSVDVVRVPLRGALLEVWEGVLEIVGKTGEALPVPGEPDVLLEAIGMDDTDTVSVIVEVEVDSLGMIEELATPEDDGMVTVMVTSLTELEGPIEGEKDPDVSETGDPEVLFTTGGMPVLMLDEREAL